MRTASAREAVKQESEMISFQDTRCFIASAGAAVRLQGPAAAAAKGTARQTFFAEQWNTKIFLFRGRARPGAIGV
jgi:hypothetical protein